MKRIVGLLLCLIMVVSCIACGKQTAKTETPTTAAAEAPKEGVKAAEEPAKPEPKYQETITIGLEADMTKLDFQDSGSVIDRAASRLTHDCLVRVNAETRTVEPCLATSWEQDKDNDAVWKFHLREGVVFNNGNPLTAEDVVFSFTRGKEKTQAKSKLSSVVSTVAEDDKTVVVTLKVANSDILYILADNTCAILDKESFDTMEEEEALKVGTGAYKCIEWKQGDQATYTAVDTCWEGVPKTKNIVFKYIPEAAARLVALQTGEIDVARTPAATDRSFIEEDPNLILRDMTGTNVRYIWFNHKVEPFNNPTLRKAVCYALDRDEIIALVYNNIAAEKLETIGYPGQEFYTSDVTKYDYNPEKAKELLAEAGYPDGLEVTLTCTTAAFPKAVATAVQSQLAKVGITVKIDTLESATFNANTINGPFQFAVDGYGAWTTGMDSSYRGCFYSTQNRCGITSEKVDELIDTALAEKDPAKRAELYKELQEYLMQDAAWYTIAIEGLVAAYKKDLQGWTLPNGTTHIYRYLYIEQ